MRFVLNEFDEEFTHMNKPLSLSKLRGKNYFWTLMWYFVKFDFPYEFLLPYQDSIEQK